MTKKTLALRDEIISIILNDATLRYHYFGQEEGAMCVIGGLMHHAGIATSVNQLPADNKAPISSIYFFGTVAALHERYGLARDELLALQQINDRYEDLEDRRNALVRHVREFFSDVK